MKRTLYAAAGLIAAVAVYTAVYWTMCQCYALWYAYAWAHQPLR